MTFASWYKENVVEAGDPRTKGWFLVDSPVPSTILLIAYYTFVRVIGPALMKHRAPMHLRVPILAYNAAQVGACLTLLWWAKDMVLTENWLCSEVFTDDEVRNARVPFIGWYYFMLKLVDLVDTVFFVLRKKQSHITFLHLFHHISMVTVTWLLLKYVPGGVLAIGPLLNLCVHTFMYAYYFVTLYRGPVDIFWKKMMTKIQLVQFVVGTSIFIINFVNPFCGFPKLLLVPVIMHGLSFIYLFSMFYYNTYNRPKPSADAPKTNGVAKTMKKTN